MVKGIQPQDGLKPRGRLAIGVSGLAILALLAGGAGCFKAKTPDAGQPNATNGPVDQQNAAGEKSLDLSGRGLTSIPMDIFSRTDLERLDLSNNNLTGAPQSQIGQLKNLKSLDLSGNRLTGLPAELGRLNKLETLNVSNNGLTGLPNELGNLTQLKVFDISGNPYSAQDLDGIAAKLTQTTIKR